MEFKIDNEIVNVEIAKDEYGFYPTFCGEPTDFTIKKINQNIFQIVKGNQSRNVYIADDDEFYYVWIDGSAIKIVKNISEEDDYGEGGSTNANMQEIKPPMPGSVVKIEVSVGDKVSEGDPLIIVEAMKMEQSLFAGIDGVVKEINVQEKQQVDTDTILAVIEKED